MLLHMWFLGLLACQDAESVPDDAPPASEGDTDPDTITAPDPSGLLQGFVPTNIVVLHTDTLRYDHTPWYGYGRLTFPRLAARTGWVRWERMYASSGWTAPSTTSLLTGLDIHNHGVRMVNEAYRDDLVQPTLASTYAEQGFATIFVSGNELFGFPAGLTAGFDVVELLEVEPSNAAANFAAALEAIDLLAPGTPFVAHIQAFDPHQPWRPNPLDLGTWADLDTLPFDLLAAREGQQAGLAVELDSRDPTRINAAKRAVVDLYDEELLGLDRSIEHLLLALDERGLLTNTLVAFTADHGESLFDRGRNYGHGASLYEELVRVPLVFYNPTLTNASVDGCLGAVMDIHPTLLTAMDVPVPAGLDGHPLQEGCRPLVTSTIYREGPDGSPVNLVQMTASTVDFKLLRVCDGAQLGYDLADDPGSLRPLDALAPAPFDLLTATLDTVEAAAAVTWPGTECLFAE